MGILASPPQYFSITAGQALAGHAQRIYATGTGTLVLTSSDGSTFTITVGANTWTSFGYPITAVGGTSTATGLTGEGYGATPTM